jgi:hypothetical protein
MWGVRVAIVAMEKQQCVLFSMLSYMSLSAMCILQMLPRKRNGESHVYCCTTMALRHIHTAGNNKTCLSVHAKCPIILSDINQLYIFSTYINKSAQYQIHENPSSGCRADADGRTDVKKLTRAFCEHAIAPKRNQNVKSKV